MNIDIAPEHLQIVQIILQKNLPIDAQVWIFGSRAKKAKRKHSDLDLLIALGNKHLPSSVIINLTEAFDESDLPYKVDIVDWNAISENFRNSIQEQRVSWNWQRI